jgi:molybdopterin synthase sulfur carrier subunit
MKVEVALFGAFREFDRRARIVVEVPDDARVAHLRQAVRAHGEAHWPGFRPGLLASSAFASREAVLRDREPVPADGSVVLLPPVCGG